MNIYFYNPSFTSRNYCWLLVRSFVGTINDQIVPQLVEKKTHLYVRMIFVIGNLWKYLISKNAIN